MWPDLAFLKGLGENLSHKNSPAFGGCFEKYIFLRKQLLILWQFLHLVTLIPIYVILLADSRVRKIIQFSGFRWRCSRSCPATSKVTATWSWCSSGTLVTPCRWISPSGCSESWRLSLMELSRNVSGSSALLQLELPLFYYQGKTCCQLPMAFFVVVDGIGTYIHRLIGNVGFWVNSASNLTI